MADPKPVQTPDLDLAAFLIAQGGSLAGTESRDGARQTFVISGDGLPAHVADYVSGTATVNVEQFRNARHLLLDRLHRGARVR